MHQLSVYHTYDRASPVHSDTLREMKLFLHQAGMVGQAADRAVLRTLRRQMDIEAIAAGFRDSFLLISLCFLLASIPMVWLMSRRWKP